METLESIRRTARERLYPSLTNPNWLVLRRRREIFQKWISELPGSDLHVLDVGGRVQPYRPLFEKRLRSYVAIDLVRTPLVNVIGCGEQIPFAGGTFDVVLCTQVLEYVEDPREVIAEIHRVLKPGGALLLSVPAVFPIDSEKDKWRFLPDSLRLLLSPFSQRQATPEGSTVSGIFRTIGVCIAMFARPVFLQNVLKFILVPFLNLAGAGLEFLVASNNEQFSVNFSALARK